MKRRTTSEAAEVLLLPFTTGVLNWPAEGALFLRAQPCSDLRTFPTASLLCEQTNKVQAQALEQAGYLLTSTDALMTRKASQDVPRRFPLVLFLPTRCREENRALLARAWQHTQPGGIVLASQSNNEGARSGEADMKQGTCGTVSSLSRSKCRVFWARKPEHEEEARSALLADWLQLDAPRPIEGGCFFSRPGLFAWSRIDAASALLAENLPDDLTGHGADIGAGFGYLAAEVVRRCPGVEAMDLYEVESRALALARQNLAEASSRVRCTYFWHDVTSGLPKGANYDFMVSNPPFHQGHADEPEIGQAFLVAAAQSLREGGRFWLVANRHLPYETLLRSRFRRVREVCCAQGFKVIEAVK